MVWWALFFLALALASGIFALADAAAAGAWMARALFVMFLVMAAALLVLARRPRS